MRLLLISNSTNYGEAYLQHARSEIAKFLGKNQLNVLFIPYAGVTVTWDDYYNKVKNVFSDLGYSLTSIHKENNPIESIKQTECIVIGGGNTFNLAYYLQKYELLEPIRNKVMSSCPYIGWSAGSNMACPTIKTTNDMPIIEPSSFNVLNIIPFQINPHYTDFVQPNHNGETREQRLLEFMKINPEVYVVGLRESTMLRIEGNSMNLIGSNSLRLMKYGIESKEFNCGENLDFLLK